MKPTSVRTRLTLSNMAVQALVLATMGIVLWYVVRATLMASIDRSLERRAHGVAEHWSRWSEMGLAGAFRRPPWFAPLPNQGAVAAKTPTPPAPQGAERRPRLFDLQGHGLDPMSTDRPWDLRAFALSIDGRELFTTIRFQGEPLRILSIPLQRAGKVAGVAQMAYSLQEVNRDLGSLTRALLMLIPLALLVTGISGAFQTNRMLRPVRRITQTAARVGAADLSERLPVAGEDEFSILARTFNGMLERLEHAFEQQRRFTADASHELRTPLTAIKAHTSLALSGEKGSEEYRVALQGANRAASLMSRIVQDLLLLARLDEGKRSLNMCPVSLCEVLTTAVEMLTGQDHAPIELEGIPSHLLVLGDSGQLVRLFTNLLDNAVRHTPLTGRIVVRTQSGPDQVRVEVIDTGVGIAPEHLPHVYERFYRVDAARSRKQGGTGLGLAICQSIVEAHGGRMEIESALAKGTTVQVTLPLPKEI